MIDDLGQFHFLRPWWLLALLPAALVLWRLTRQRADAGAWERVVDAHLLRHLLGGDGQRRTSAGISVLGSAWMIAVLALAGPSWSKAPQATYHARHALVIVLSLAPTMDAGDVAPSRLVRARLKVLDILARRREGQTALIAYSDAPYTVAPLTEDARTIAALVPVLATDVMPAPGDKLSAALERARELLAQAGVARGEVLVVADSAVDVRANDAAQTLNEAGHRVSVLAVGGTEGAPIPLRGGGFLTDAAGGIVVHKVDAARLQLLAKNGGGAFATIAVDDADLAAVLPAVSGEGANAAPKENGASSVVRWRDEGPWLVVLLLPLVALLFRRGWLVGIAAVYCLHLPPPVLAFEIDELWLRSDQRAQQALEAEDYERAAELATDPMRKGEALYRAKKYAEAAEQFAQVDSADGHYNRGNALAKAGRYADARAAYVKALEKIPTHANAKYNKALIDQLLKREPPPPQQSQDSSQQSGEKSGSQKSGPSQSAGGGAAEDRGAEDAGAQSKSVGAGSGAQETPKSGEPQRNAGAEPGAGTSPAAQAGATPREGEGHNGNAQAVEQWLGKVPDDPGGLLREKFRREYLRRMQQQGDER